MSVSLSLVITLIVGRSAEEFPERSALSNLVSRYLDVADDADDDDVADGADDNDVADEADDDGVSDGADDDGVSDDADDDDDGDDWDDAGQKVMMMISHRGWSSAHW